MAKARKLEFRFHARVVPPLGPVLCDLDYYPYPDRLSLASSCRLVETSSCRLVEATQRGITGPACCPFLEELKESSQLSSVLTVASFRDSSLARKLM
jgi:hypothetical protein